MSSAATAANPLVEFLDRYADDPVLFVREVLGGDPDPKQIEAMQAVARRERRISIRSGHGVGKTTVLAWLIVWHVLCKYPQKTVATAPTTSQLFDALAAETKAWAKSLPTELQSLLDIKSEGIELAAAPDVSFVSFKTSRPETPEALAGVHSVWVLLIGDEASGIPEQVYESAVGSMSGHNAVTILAGNPVRSTGLFYRSHKDPQEMLKWHRIHIPCVGHPRISDDFIEDVKTRYGEESNAYRVRVLGEFPLADDDTVFPFELVEPALKREVKPLLVRPIWGVDCARFGADTSALAVRQGNVLVEKVLEFKGLDTMQLVGRIKSRWDATLPSDRPTDICVDVIGIGAGVVDRLIELKLPARGINVAESPALGERYTNLRAELHFKGREWFAKKDCSINGDERLMAELLGPRYDITSSGKIQVEAKKDMKKRGLRSPNLVDAFLLTLAVDAITASEGANVRGSWATPLKRVIRGIV